MTKQVNNLTIKLTNANDKHKNDKQQEDEKINKVNVNTTIEDTER